MTPQEIVDAFNEHYPIGTLVFCDVKGDDGEEGFTAHTKAPAFILGRDITVVEVENRTGNVSLDYVYIPVVPRP